MLLSSVPAPDYCNILSDRTRSSLLFCRMIFRLGIDSSPDSFISRRTTGSYLVDAILSVGHDLLRAT